MLETAQTALLGSDVYYWFIDGFGDYERLHDSHFVPIDTSIMGVIATLTVQMYFCYRIWTLTRNTWLCVVIALVCTPDLPAFVRLLTFLNIDVNVFSIGVIMGGHRSKYCSDTPGCLIYANFRHSLVERLSSPRPLFMYAHSFRYR